MELNKENASSTLLEFRDKHKITQEKISEKTGISRPTISGIETGRLTPQTMTIYKLNKFIKSFE